MEFDNSFDVPLPPDAAWKTLMDIERIVPCMPGASLTEKIDDRTFKGKVSVRLGPVALTFGGEAKFVEVDDQNHRAQVKAQGQDAKGRGGASATVGFHLEPVPAGSKVMVHTDLALSGSVAQYGRGAGMIQDLASRLIGQFADQLKAQLAHSAAVAAAAAAPALTGAGGTAAAAPPPPPPPPPAKPISGFSLLFGMLWDRLRRLFGMGR